MDVNFKLYQRPTDKDVIKQIITITKSLTGKWFTQNVPEDTEWDLKFQDVLCIMVDDEIASFIMFTSLDGTINITLMGTKLECHGSGLGSKLMNCFFNYVRGIGFDQIKLLTVPPRVKPAYESTVNFYIKNGFIIGKEYRELWENGAVEMNKYLGGI